MNRHRRFTALDAIAVLAGLGLAIWGVAGFSADAAKILAGTAVLAAGLVGRRPE